MTVSEDISEMNTGPTSGDGFTRNGDREEIAESSKLSIFFLKSICLYWRCLKFIYNGIKSWCGDGLGVFDFVEKSLKSVGDAVNGLYTFWSAIYLDCIGLSGMVKESAKTMLRKPRDYLVRSLFRLWIYCNCLFRRKLKDLQKIQDELVPPNDGEEVEIDFKNSSPGDMLFQLNFRFGGRIFNRATKYLPFWPGKSDKDSLQNSEDASRPNSMPLVDPTSDYSETNSSDTASETNSSDTASEASSMSRTSSQGLNLSSIQEDRTGENQESA